MSSIIIQSHKEALCSKEKGKIDGKTYTKNQKVPEDIKEETLQQQLGTHQ